MGSAWSYLLALGAFGTSIAAGVYSYDGHATIKSIANYQSSRRLSDAAYFLLLATIASWIMVLIIAYIFVRLLRGDTLPTFLLVICVLLSLVVGVLGAAAAEYISHNSFYKSGSTYSEARSDSIFTSIFGFVTMLLFCGVWVVTTEKKTPTVTVSTEKKAPTVTVSTEKKEPSNKAA